MQDMTSRPMTPANLAVDRVLERAVHVNRPAQHTMVMGGSVNERREVLDRIEARLRDSTSGTPPHIGRLREPYRRATANASELWVEVARAAGLTEQSNFHTSALGQIQNAAADRLVVVIIDNLDTLLAGWCESGEALNLRWVMQNINGLMIVAGVDGPIGLDGPHDYSILAMTFAKQSL